MSRPECNQRRRALLGARCAEPASYHPLVLAYLLQGKPIHRLPPGKSVPTEVFIDRFKLSVEQRLRLWRAGG